MGVITGSWVAAGHAPAQGPSAAASPRGNKGESCGENRHAIRVLARGTQEGARGACVFLVIIYLTH